MFAILMYICFYKCRNMKKIILVPLVIFLSLSFSNAQDTIIFKDYPKPVICKIKNITADKINYYEDGDYYSVDLSSVQYYSKSFRESKEIVSQAPANSGKPEPLYKPKGYVAFSIGPSFPFGNYKDSGFANTGINLSLSGEHPFEHSNFGIAYKLDYGFNSINQAGFLSTAQSIIYNATGNPNLTFSVNSIGSYSYESALFGFCEMFPDQNFSIDFRLLAGVMFANVPAVSISVYDYGNMIGTSSQQAASSAALCLDFGVCLRFTITHEIGFIVNFDLMYSNPQFSVTATAIGSSGPYTASGTANQLFYMGNLTFGLAWTPTIK